MTKAPTTVKSININSIFGKPKKDDLNKIMFTVMGVATGAGIHLSKFGESVFLKGDFAAVNAKTGEIFTSNAAFLNKQLTTEIAKKLENGVNEVEFKADVKVIPSDKNTSGVAYIAEEPMTEARKNRQNSLIEQAQKQSQLLIGSK